MCTVEPGVEEACDTASNRGLELYSSMCGRPSKPTACETAVPLQSSRATTGAHLSGSSTEKES